jgi:hypothetical protein
VTEQDDNGIEGQYTRPPLGVMPKYFWLSRRMADVSAAINRYAESGIDVPSHWIEEMVWIAVQIQSAKRERQGGR